MDLLCFDITENFFESNIWFLDGCVGYCCTAPLTVWLIWFLCVGYCGTAQLTIWLTRFLMNLFDFLFFLTIAILSRSSQTRFVCRDVLLSLNFLGSFSFFAMGSFCVFPKKLKLRWLVVSFLIFLFLVPIGKKWHYCFIKRFLQIFLTTVFLILKA